jgi:predicted small lipoprotein YifL
MRRIVSCGLAAALLAGAAGCGGNKKAELPDNAKKDIGKPVVLGEEAPKTKKELAKSQGQGAD